MPNEKKKLKVILWHFCFIKMERIAYISSMLVYYIIYGLFFYLTGTENVLLMAKMFQVEVN